MASFWKIKITTLYTVNYVLPNNWEITTKIDIDYYQIWWDARKCSPQNQPFGRKCTTNEKKEKICDIPELFVAKTDPNRLPTLDEKKGEVLNNRSRETNRETNFAPKNSQKIVGIFISADRLRSSRVQQNSPPRNMRMILRGGLWSPNRYQSGSYMKALYCSVRIQIEWFYRQKRWAGIGIIKKRIY